MPIPEISKIYISLYNASVNEYINYYIYNKSNINFNIFIEIEIYGGNSYYRLLSKFMTKNEKYHLLDI